MGSVWIIGAGQFGVNALKRLSKQHKGWQFVLVDKVLEKLLKAKGPNTIIEHIDGIKFLNDRLKPGANVSWIIPSLPIHLAWEWCRVKIGLDRLVPKKVSSEIDFLLPNPMQGVNGDIYVSNADFICPSNCSEPKEFCTVTKHSRKQNMFDRLGALYYKGYAPIVLRSKQIAPGIGGYSPAQLFSFFEKVKQSKGPLLLCTTCRCHGVITGVDRL